MKRVSAIILAAGESRRMGRQKALLEWHGVPLIQYELEQLASITEIEEVIVVTGHEPASIEAIVVREPKARAVHNDAYMTGKVSSIRTGLRAVSPDADGVLLCAVDQPRPAAIIERLIAERNRPITIPMHDGHRGHPLLFDTSLLAELRDIDDATMGVRAVVERDPSRVSEVAFDDPDVLLDLNAPSDLPALEDS